MSQRTKPLTVFTSETGRRYVDVADLAEISGVSEVDLDRKHRPMAWGSPREMRWDGRRLWFAVMAIPQLCDSLDSNGESDAALKLRTWCVAWVEACVSESERNAARTGRKNFDAGAQPVRCTSEAGTDGSASTPMVPAARVDSSHRPVSGAEAQQRWEDAQS